jgi:hypothetical protein
LEFPAQAANPEVAAMEALASAAFLIKSRRLFFSVCISVDVMIVIVV